MPHHEISMWSTSVVTELARYPALSHVVIALMMQAAIGVTLTRFKVERAWWYGAAVVIGFYYSRKKFEMELHVDPSGHHKAQTWNVGLLPTSWPSDYQLQFYAPALMAILMAVLVHRRDRR